MNTGIRQNGHGPTDMEIERDVAELRRMLDGIEGPREPHPAYWQNFLVHTRQRLDEKQSRRRFSPSVAWASLSAAAFAVVLVVGGILPTSTPTPSATQVDNGIAASQPAPSVIEDENDFFGGLDGELAAALPNADQVLDNSTSLVLSTEDVNMLNAIMSEEDDDAIFNAMIESGGSL